MINGNDYIEWMSLLGIIPVKRVIHNGIIMSYIIRSSYPHFTVDKSQEPRHTADYTLWITSQKTHSWV